jgi:hypothetical protein
MAHVEILSNELADFMVFMALFLEIAELSFDLLV